MQLQSYIVDSYNFSWQILPNTNTATHSKKSESAKNSEISICVQWTIITPAAATKTFEYRWICFQRRRFTNMSSHYSISLKIKRFILFELNHLIKQTHLHWNYSYRKIGWSYSPCIEIIIFYFDVVVCLIAEQLWSTLLQLLLKGDFSIELELKPCAWVFSLESTNFSHKYQRINKNKEIIKIKQSVLIYKCKNLYFPCFVWNKLK